MPNSTPEARVVGVTGNIVSVESDAPANEEFDRLRA